MSRAELAQGVEERARSWPLIAGTLGPLGEPGQVAVALLGRRKITMIFGKDGQFFGC